MKNLISILIIINSISGCNTEHKIKGLPENEIKVVTSGTTSVIVKHEVEVTVDMKRAFQAECESEGYTGGDALQDCIDEKTLQFIRDVLGTLNQADPNLPNKVDSWI